MGNGRKPLLLRPSGKDYLWGGSRLNDEFEKNIDMDPLAETWECSTHPDGPSYVVGGAFDGQELAEVLKAHPEYLGERHKGENTLPILIKFIDAKKDLSVQVHPTDEYAQENENGQLGKTEMWYVLDASKDAKLVYGLKRERTEQQMRDAIAKGTLMKDLQWVPVKKDDLFFIKAGTIHAIGAGALVAEIQENSNLTYRLYDYDRVGIAVKNKAGEYELLTGNQTGMLLLDYICSQRVKHGKMPADPVMVKTIVTMDMGEQIATHYGLRTINVLTGFKFIGEQIGKLEQQGRADSYVFGFEESYGYLTGSYVRDKDGVDGAYMICEMFSYYATQGISLLDKLDELYKTYGYCLNTLHSYEFDGSAGFAKMQSIMQAFRGGIQEFGGKKVVKLLDYAPGLDGLPKSDVLKFLLEDNCSIVVRPSGTEPKLKTYISVSAENKGSAEKIEAEICKSAEGYLK